jgi:hypothetical protein
MSWCIFHRKVQGVLTKATLNIAYFLPRIFDLLWITSAIYWSGETPDVICKCGHTADCPACFDDPSYHVSSTAEPRLVTALGSLGRG